MIKSRWDFRNRHSGSAWSKSAKFRRFGGLSLYFSTLARNPASSASRLRSLASSLSYSASSHRSLASSLSHSASSHRNLASSPSSEFSSPSYESCSTRPKSSSHQSFDCRQSSESSSDRHSSLPISHIRLRGCRIVSKRTASFSKTSGLSFKMIGTSRCLPFPGKALRQRGENHLTAFPSYQRA